MKIIFAGNPPYNCPLFDFQACFTPAAMSEGIECFYLSDSPIKLPMTLWRMAGKWAEDEKVVIVATTPRGVAGASSARSIMGGRKLEIIFMPDTSAMADPREWINLGRYTELSTLTLYASTSLRESMHPITKTKYALLPPPAIATGQSSAQSPSTTTLLYQGEITRNAPLEEAVKVVADTPGTRLVVNGTGKGRWAMPAVKLARALDLGERVAWNGNDNDSTVMEASPATILLVPEPERTDQQVVIASYMLAGVIVVARDTEAARALITDGTDGLLVPEFSPGELARIVTLPAPTRQAISTAATSRAAALTAAHFTSTLLSHCLNL